MLLCLLETIMFTMQIWAFNLTMSPIFICQMINYFTKDEFILFLRYGAWEQYRKHDPNSL